MAVIAGTTAAILRSLFGQLHKEALTSPAEVDPDPPVFDFLTVKLSQYWVRSSFYTFIFEMLTVKQDGLITMDQHLKSCGFLRGFDGSSERHQYEFPVVKE